MTALPRTRDRVELALAKIAEGFTPRSACGATGVSWASLKRWRAECEANEEAFDAAYHQGLAVDEELLRRAFEDNPHLRLQYLLRKHADLSSKREVEVKGNVAVKVEHAYAPEAIDAFYREIGEWRGQLDAPSSPSTRVLAQGRTVDDGLADDSHSQA